MPEGQIGAEGEGGSGKGGDGGVLGPGSGVVAGAEVIAEAGVSPEEYPAGGCGEVIDFMREQWLADRGRAQRVEQEAESLRARLNESESALAAAREALDAAERRHRIDLLLIESETVDLESARLLTEMAASQMPDRDVAAVVGELKRRKPFLFRGRRSGVMTGAAMSPASSPGDPAEQAAEEAVRTGDRGALLRYLRARRGG
ncbi:MAG: hypothetical protein JNK58_06135 [Phycisphaerae bacterium]|nr:hypothetical protein [Phycisphaerae bacterium]